MPPVSLGRPTPPALPAGAVDAHVHVFDPSRFRYAQARSYTPGPASLEALCERHAELGIHRTVLVQPSVYGVDNACLLDALNRLGTERARGIAVLDVERTGEADIDALHRAGIRGVRLNLKTGGSEDMRTPAQALDRLAQRVRRPDWCVQLHGGPALLELLADRIDRFESQVVLDHFAGLGAAHAQSHPGAFDTLMGLLGTGRVWVKLSAPYRVSSDAPAHDDLVPLMSALLQAAPERLVWGSDWPHTGGDGTREKEPAQIEAFRTVDLPVLLHSLWRACADDAAAWHRVLVDNPSTLYGFAPDKALA
jgi:predicted TIM-barrel fold metal-dependent hydrolase